MVTRGFWGSHHYWCQVVQSVEGILGVWHYDERKNAGFAQLISRNVNSIAGCSDHTSWVCYSRVPFEEERKKIEAAIISMMKNFPTRHHSITFSMPTASAPFGGGLPSLEETVDDSTAPTTVDIDAEDHLLNLQIWMNSTYMIKKIRLTLLQFWMNSTDMCDNYRLPLLLWNVSTPGPLKIKLLVQKQGLDPLLPVEPKTKKSVTVKAESGPTAAQKRKAAAAEKRKSAAAEKRKATADKRKAADEECMAAAELHKAAAAEKRKAAAERRDLAKKKDEA
ncbi:uncharacterized protein MELLADRAFT_85097 [Melampsora larici-populina 98AG31]|uniref:Uncharacterized protein n=1 Tax=Melampsora larici-populina (strain 98AG31 / pathotype 3-4-7) TaxID=747676 RepID=F4SCU0_MELLP|nr:uncharacterized protein MELLADRAFT_85097 [Melampsora larici-populina 98AG31]EGF97538.1 hypothetical protein MELLADRAFT_85097 [Melampsora larici-populina 98AG31]